MDATHWLKRIYDTLVGGLGAVTAIIKDPAGDTANVTGTSLDVNPTTLPPGAATQATSASIDGKITACNTGAVTVSASALPADAATSTKQSDGTQKTQIADDAGGTGATVDSKAVCVRSKLIGTQVDLGGAHGDTAALVWAPGVAIGTVVNVDIIPATVRRSYVVTVRNEATVTPLTVRCCHTELTMGPGAGVTNYSVIQAFQVNVAATEGAVVNFLFLPGVAARLILSNDAVDAPGFNAYVRLRIAD